MQAFNSYFRTLSLHLKMLFITSITVFTALFCSFILLLLFDAIIHLTDLKKQLTITGKTLSSNIHSSLVFGDQDFANEVMASLNIQENILVATLYKKDNSLFAQYQHTKNIKAQSFNKNLLEGISRQGLSLIYIEKLYLDDRLIGTLSINYQLKSYLYLLLLEASLGFLIFLFSAFVAYKLWLKLQPSITQPIFELLSSIHQITENNDYSLQVPKQVEDELGELIDGFNEMLLQIQNRDKLIEANTKQLELRVAERTQELLHEKLKAESANRTKSEFLAMVSHEIRTPLNSIMGFSYITLRSNLSQEQINNVENIYQSAESLLGIISDILDFSKIEVGKFEIDIQPFSLNKIIHYIHNSMSVIAAQKGLNFGIDCATNIPKFLLGDAKRLQQILINLVSNAIKFTAQGNVNISITCEHNDSKKTRLAFSVSDTGIGITEEDQHNLFQLFTQVDSSITRKFGGTGLGLAISQQLVMLMGGKIFVSSYIDQGTNFYFSLDFERSNFIDESSNDIKPFYKDIPSELTGCRVLVVEDQFINQQVVEVILNQAGIEVSIASNGIEAIKILESKKHYFDIILMDLQMPEMSGYEATEYIRKKIQLIDIPIIIMTANILAGNKPKLEECGMNDYIPKPFVPDQLYSILVKWFKPDSLSIQATKVPANIQYNKTDVLLKNLPGINIKIGLSSSAGNLLLYKKLLLQFYNSKKQIFNDLQLAFINKDIKKYHFISHAMTGLSGTLGAQELFKQSQNLVLECKNEELNRQSLDLFEQAFNEVMTGLENFEKNSQTEITAK
ncbi:MAG: ATP-binding protein [Pseudomonadota bacterium]